MQVTMVHQGPRCEDLANAGFFQGRDICPFGKDGYHSGWVFTLQGYVESGEFSFPMTKETIRLKELFEREAAAHLHESPLAGTVRLKDYEEERVLLEAAVLVNRQLRC
jgi:hypothetical protein